MKITTIKRTAFNRIVQPLEPPINLGEFSDRCVENKINIGDSCSGRIPLETPKATVYVYKDKYVIPILYKKFDTQCSLGFILEYVEKVISGVTVEFWDIVTEWVKMNAKHMPKATWRFLLEDAKRTLKGEY